MLIISQELEGDARSTKYKKWLKVVTNYLRS